MRRASLPFPALIPALAVLLGLTASAGDGSPKPPKIPAVVEIEAAPSPAAPGDSLAVVVRLTPVDGVKLNRYPKLSLDVPAVDGLVAAARVELGSEAPPRPGSGVDNYWDGDSLTVELDLPVDGAAARGEHRVPGRLRYFFCVAESGFCARESVDVTIPLTIR